MHTCDIERNLTYFIISSVTWVDISTIRNRIRQWQQQQPLLPTIAFIARSLHWRCMPWLHNTGIRRARARRVPRPLGSSAWQANQRVWSRLAQRRAVPRLTRREFRAPADAALWPISSAAVLAADGRVLLSSASLVVWIFKWFITCLPHTRLPARTVCVSALFSCLKRFVCYCYLGVRSVLSA